MGNLKYASVKISGRNHKLDVSNKAAGIYTFSFTPLSLFWILGITFAGYIILYMNLLLIILPSVINLNSFFFMLQHLYTAVFDKREDLQVVLLVSLL